MDEITLFPDDFDGLPPIVQAKPPLTVYHIIERTDLVKLEAAVNAYFIEHEHAYALDGPSKIGNEQFIQTMITYGVDCT